MKANSRERKGIKKAIRLLAGTLLFLLLLPVILGGSLLIPAVQTEAVSYAATEFGDYLGAEVDIESIYLKPFSSLQLNGLLVKDLQDDTLAFVSSLDVGVLAFDKSFSFLNLGEVNLETAYFNLYQLPDSSLNMDFIIDAFSSEDTTSSDQQFELSCSRFELSDARFRYQALGIADAYEGINFSDLDIRQLNAVFEDISLVGSDVQAHILDLTLADHSGLEVKHLQSLASVSADSIAAHALQLETNRSIVQGDLEMHYDGWSDFGAFLTEVKLKATLEKSRIAVDDIAFFAPILQGTLTDVDFTGKVNGTIDNLKTSIDTLRFLNSAYLSGNVRLRGLPDPDALFIQSNVRQLYVPISELNGLALPSAEPQILELPEVAQVVGALSFQGSYTGFFQDFVAYGNLQSAVGNLELDLNLKTQKEQVRYIGNVKSNGLDIDALVGSGQIGQAAFDLNVEGHDFDLKKMSVEAKGTVHSIELMGYEYKDVSLDGTLDQRIFNGNLDVRDTNIVLDFAGRVDLTDEVPEIHCKTSIERLNLAALNLLPEDSLSTLSGAFSLDMAGDTKEKLHGEFVLSDFDYHSQTRSLQLDTARLIDQLTDEGHSIELVSDYFDITINGATTLFDLPSAFQQLAAAYLPHYFPMKEQPADTLQHFAFRVDLQQESHLLELISPKLSTLEDIELSGRVDTRTNYLDLRSNSISLLYGEASYNDIRISMAPRADSLLLQATCAHIELSEDYFVSNVIGLFDVHADTLAASVQWANSTQRGDCGSIGFNMAAQEARVLEIGLTDFDVVTGGVNWYSTNRARIHIDSASTEIQKLLIQSEDGSIACDGRLSDLENDTLKLELRSVDLSYISKLGLTAQKVGGILNSEVDIRQSGDAVLVNANLNAKHLFYQDIEFGDIYGSSSYSAITNSVGLDVELDYQEQKNIRVKGNYYPFEAEDQLDVTADFQSFRVVLLEPFLERFVSDLEGEINGSVSVKGKLAEPQLNGDLNLDGFSTKVNYLNTSYTIPTGTVNIREDYIGCDVLPLIDEKGQQGFATATIFHTNFQNLNYDIFLDVDNFLCLNTSAAQNELYYGRANISGDVSISGSGDETSIEVIAATNKNTQLFIPLDKPGEVNDVEYIHFVGDDAEERLELLQERAREQLKGLVLNFQLAVDEKAEVQIIFDEKIGDIIKVRGRGDMLMEIDTRGKFNMYGDYTINSGDYLFTLQNVVNKKFAVAQGSKIAWNGSPYDAQVDLAAIYNLRTSPYTLVASTGDTSDYYKQRMPVELYLKMKGALMDPVLSFDVNLPSLPESDLANQLLAPGTMNAQDLNKQVFSLLLVGAFAPQQGFSTEGLSSTTGFEVLSNQFSNWASQYFESVDIAINYRRGDQETTSDQAELTLSKELFDDRVLLEVNGTVRGDNPGNEDASNVAGEFNVEYKISESDNSSLRARVFNEANNYSAVNLNQSPYTQGAGIFYRKEFDGNGFFKRLFARKEDKAEINEEAPAEEPEVESPPSTLPKVDAEETNPVDKEMPKSEEPD